MAFWLQCIMGQRKGSNRTRVEKLGPDGVKTIVVPLMSHEASFPITATELIPASLTVSALAHT